MFYNIFYDAKAEIKGSDKYPNIEGIILFNEKTNGVLITARIKNLPINEHKGRFFAFHIHEGSNCTGINFEDSKKHLNPSNLKHPYHLGDLPPLIECNGNAYMQVLVDKFKIDDIIGRTIIIHDGIDDFKTQPSGDSGSKIACGEIKKRI